jgi:hypothetical protein
MHGATAKIKPKVRFVRCLQYIYYIAVIRRLRSSGMSHYLFGVTFPGASKDHRTVVFRAKHATNKYTRAHPQRPSAHINVQPCVT